MASACTWGTVLAQDVAVGAVDVAVGAVENALWRWKARPSAQQKGQLLG